MEKAAPILAFVGSIAGCLLIGTLWFLRVDSVERKIILKDRWHASKGLQKDVAKKDEKSAEQLHLLNKGKSGVESFQETDNLATTVQMKPIMKLIPNDADDDPKQQQPSNDDDDHSVAHVQAFAERVLDQKGDLLGGKMMSSDGSGMGHSHYGLDETMFLSMRDRLDQ